MSYVMAFGRFWYDFIVGDDWTIAVAVVVGLALSNLLVRAHIDSWWLLPVFVVAFLAASLWRATRAR